jgi:adenylate kinase
VYIVFLGAPGAGKGTQAANVARKLGLVPIASGDLFRQAVERGDELGKKVEAYLEKGMLVPDEITVRMVLERMSAPDCQGGVILDGFPRNLKQAEALDEALKRQNKIVNWVVYIKVSEKELIKRLSQRWVCRNCQAPYYNMASHLKAKKKCKLCGGELYQRADDNSETVKKRLDVYFTETTPLIEYYRQTGRLLEVDGEGSIDDITGRIARALRESEFIAG